MLLKTTSAIILNVEHLIFEIVEKLGYTLYYENNSTIHNTTARIIYAYTSHVIQERSAWLKDTYNKSSTLNWLSEYILDEYTRNTSVHEEIYSLLTEYRHTISNFIGKDIWVQHTFRYRGYEILLEKTIDYRIHWYMSEIYNEETDIRLPDYSVDVIENPTSDDIKRFFDSN